MTNHTKKWILSVDGAARNNPGPAGAGVYLTQNDTPVIERGFYLGSKTNNQAEYLALMLGVYLSKAYLQPSELLHIRTDSQLLVKQFLGEYAVRKKHLIPLYQKIKELLVSQRYHLVHIPRAENAMADALANKGIDHQVPVPGSFLKIYPL